MQSLAFWQALIIALWVGLVMSRTLLGGASTTLRFTPMMTGLICGIVMGNVPMAMMITAAIQLIYMGVFSPGGTMPSEPCVAAAIAVPFALLTNPGLAVTSSVQDIQKATATAIAFAVPFGLLGSYLYSTRFFINTFVVKLTDRNAENGDHKALTRSVITYPFLVGLLLFGLFIFIVLFFGAQLLSGGVSALASGPVFHVLSVIGSGLPAIGIAVTIYVIGKKSYLVFFVLAYFMATTVNSITAAVNGIANNSNANNGVIVKAVNAITNNADTAIKATNLGTWGGVNMLTWAIIGIIIAVVFVLVKREATAAN